MTAASDSSASASDRACRRRVVAVGDGAVGVDELVGEEVGLRRVMSCERARRQRRRRAVELTPSSAVGAPMRVGRVVGVQRQRRRRSSAAPCAGRRSRRPRRAWSTDRAALHGAAGETLAVVDEHLVRGVPVQAVDVDERDLDDRRARDRAASPRRRASWLSAANGSPSNVARERRLPADVGVVEVGEREERRRSRRRAPSARAGGSTRVGW